MQTLRYADPATVQHYPLQIASAARWEAIDGGWRSVFELADVPGESIIAPSFSLLGDPAHCFQFTLETSKGTYPLPPVPSAEPIANPSDRRIRTAIDCFHTLKNCKQVRLTLTCTAQKVPERYLATVSVRPAELSEAAAMNSVNVRVKTPPTHSQMLENPRIARGVCSPVSTAMVLEQFRPGVTTSSVIAACYDPVTRMYGSWPLAVRAASGVGCIGAVELFSGWEPVVTCLQRGLSVVASIRYGRGELPGAPQLASGGHLIVVHGLEASEALVNDPAAPNHGTVNRRYPLEALAQAWFRYRGAAYILTP